MKHSTRFHSPKISHEPARFRAEQLKKQQKAIDMIKQKPMGLSATGSFLPHYRKRVPHLPPHIREKYSKPKAVSFSLLRVVNQVVSKKQLISIIFILMLAGAHAHDMSSGIERARGARSLRREIDKDTLLREVCTDTSLATLNKPDFQLAISAEGYEVPKSCLLLNAEAQCMRDLDAWRQFTPNQEKMDRIYSQYMAAYQQWKQPFLQKWEILQPDRHSAKDETTSNIWKIVSNLAFLSHSMSVIQAEKGGNCADHAKVALGKLIQHRLTYGLDIRIHRVQLFSRPDSKTVDHMYLLLDSDMSEINIKNDAHAVKQYLGSISQGIICDTWNQVFGDFITDVNGFYHNRYSHHTKDWASLVIDDFSIDFTKLKDLSHQMKQFVCEQIAALGFHLEHEPLCMSFFGKKSSAHEREETDLNQVQNIRP